MRNYLVRLIILLLALALFLGVVWRFTSGNQESPAPAAKLQPPAVDVSPTPTPLTANMISPRPKVARGPSPAGPPDELAMLELDKISLMIRDYRTLAGENPVGTNAEIMSAVMGGNPKQAKLGPPEGAHLNDKGELIDRWGTPYFFHQLSKTHMEIRSAGPDKIMWTADDPVVR